MEASDFDIAYPAVVKMLRPKIMHGEVCFRRLAVPNTERPCKFGRQISSNDGIEYLQKLIDK